MDVVLIEKFKRNDANYRMQDTGHRIQGFFDLGLIEKFKRNDAAILQRPQRGYLVIISARIKHPAGVCEIMLPNNFV